MAEAVALPYAVWATPTDEEGNWDEFPLVHLGPDHPDSDMASLMRCEGDVGGDATEATAGELRRISEGGRGGQIWARGGGGGERGEG